MFISTDKTKSMHVEAQQKLAPITVEEIENVEAK